MSAYEIGFLLGGSEMCIRDSDDVCSSVKFGNERLGRIAICAECQSVCCGCFEAAQGVAAVSVDGCGDTSDGLPHGVVHPGFGGDAELDWTVVISSFDEDLASYGARGTRRRDGAFLVRGLARCRYLGFIGCKGGETVSLDSNTIGTG